VRETLTLLLLVVLVSSPLTVAQAQQVWLGTNVDTDGLTTLQIFKFNAFPFGHLGVGGLYAEIGGIARCKRGTTRCLRRRGRIIGDYCAGRGLNGCEDAALVGFSLKGEIHYSDGRSSCQFSALFSPPPESRSISDPVAPLIGSSLSGTYGCFLFNRRMRIVQLSGSFSYTLASGGLEDTPLRP